MSSVVGTYTLDRLSTYAKVSREAIRDAMKAIREQQEFFLSFEVI
jgi:hypothetical protein